MATIDISRSHTLAKDVARARAEELAKGLETKLGLTWKWSGDAIRFEAPSGVAKGMTGEVAVTDREVRVTVELPFLLRVMKGTIEHKIEEKLSQLL